jgi:hypothetical protein
MFIYHQNAGQNHNIKIANRVFGIEAKLKYFEIIHSNKTKFHSQEVNSILNFDDS